MLQGLVTRITKLNTLYIGTILFIATFFCYGNTLGNGLFFDDEQFIYNNQFVRTFNIPGLFENSLITGSGKLSNYYRPLLFVGFATEYQIFTDNGFIYHLNSVLLHFLGGLLLFLLIKKLFNNMSIALITSLLFIIHPVQTEAVSYASGRGDPLSFVFVMLSLIFSLLKSRKYIILSIVFMMGALLSKELALVTPGLIFIVHLFKQKSLTKNSLKKCLLFTLPFGVIAVSYFILRITVLNFSNTLNFSNITTIYSSSLFVRLNTFFHLFPSYVQLLIFPKELFMERDSGIGIQILPTFKSMATVIIFLLGAALAIIKRGSSRIFLFGFGWIGITFIPTTGIIPINGIFYEHFLYYPSVGFFLIFSLGIFRLYHISKSWLKELILLLILLGILLLSVRTILRNTEWNNPITFYNQTLTHVQSPRAYNNLAMAYADKGMNLDAIRTYKKAISISDTYPESHFNLANTYLAINNKPSAESEYKKAIEIDPNFYLAHGSLYQMYKKTGNAEGVNWVISKLSELGSINSGYTEYLRQLQAQ